MKWFRNFPWFTHMGDMNMPTSFFFSFFFVLSTDNKTNFSYYMFFFCITLISIMYYCVYVLHNWKKRTDGHNKVLEWEESARYVKRKCACRVMFCVINNVALSSRLKHSWRFCPTGSWDVVCLQLFCLPPPQNLKCHLLLSLYKCSVSVLMCFIGMT